MSLKPILFNTAMVKAIRAGQKTQTRRVIREPSIEMETNVYPNGYIQTSRGVWTKPPYQRGDILWVRETWAYAPDDDPNFRDFIYQADDETPEVWHKTAWRPSIHMPYTAARLFLRVTRIRVERLWDGFFPPLSCPMLSIRAEGIDIGDTCRECIDSYGEPCCTGTTDDDGSDEYGGECGMLDGARADFARLWDSTVKKTELERFGWAANPWVWTVSFERAEKGGGKYERA
ncbi:MAG: hypothetical protein VB039_05245 [Oscillospiraceae bacterium]|nr:hypothetical protein [Oscillospiraceae bacterium]